MALIGWLVYLFVAYLSTYYFMRGVARDDIKCGFADATLFCFYIIALAIAPLVFPMVAFLWTSKQIIDNFAEPIEAFGRKFFN